MRQPRIIWGGTLGALVLVDLWAAYNAIDGDSLSEVVRDTFRTDTNAGRAVLIGAWVGLSAWVIPHWCRHIDLDRLAT